MKTKTMKRVLLCFAISFLTYQLYSQFDYRPGYIIMNSGDSIYGLIDFRNDISNSQHVNYKKDSNSIVQEYLPDQLKAYYFIDGKYYISKKIRLNDNEKIVFLEFLLLGKVNIFYGALEDKNTDDMQLSRNEYYYIEKNGELVGINNDIITYTNSTGKALVRNSNQYKGVLKSFLSDCPGIFKTVDNIDFDQKSLIKIAKNYHEKMCPDTQCIIFEKPISKRKYYFGIEYNYVFPRLSFYSSGSRIFSDSSPESAFSIGVFGATNIDNDYRAWFQVNIKYTHLSFSNSGLYRDIYPVYFEYEFSSLLTDLLVKYRFSLSKLKPYILGGLIIGYITNDQYDIRSSIRIDQAYAYNGKGIFGIKAGSGIEYSLNSKINIYLSFDYNYYLTVDKFTISGLALNAGLFF